MRKVLFGVGIGMIVSFLILTAALNSLPATDAPASLPAYLTGVSIPKERASPADRISQNDIHVLNNQVIIDVDEPEWAMFTDTNSMDPVFDAGANAIEIVPKSESEIEVGDIVSYKSEYADGTIIHRVAQIGQDENGWYATMKGDNNPNADPGKIRFSQIERVVVAVIY